MAYPVINRNTTLSQWVKDTMDDLNNTIHYEIQDPEPGAFSFHAGANDEMLRVDRDGFYVRGVKVPADDKEAEIVYNAFKQWLAWANLQQGR